MPKNFSDKTFYRIIDANINRAGEGLRVSEEFTRFILDDSRLTSKLKSIRHGLRDIVNRLPVERFRLIEERDSLRDVGKGILGREVQREDYSDIILANLARVKESVRVLEEFSKLVSQAVALRFKEMRYGVYDIEKKIIKRIKALPDIRP